VRTVADGIEQAAALERLKAMRLTDLEASFVVGCLSASAPAAVQRALDSVQRHRQALHEASQRAADTESDGLCRCSWLGAGMPPHDPSGFHPTGTAPNASGADQ
jgi:hypothetical protein